MRCCLKRLKEIIKMTNTKRTSKSIIATLIAVIIAVSSFAMISAVSANAAYEGSAQAHAAQKSEIVVSQAAEKTAKTGELAKAYYFKAIGKTSYGYDWTYKTDNNNVKVKCKYDFKTNKYTFKIVGTAKGTNHFTLKYKTSDKKTVSVPMTFVVDAQKNIIRVK